MPVIKGLLVLVPPSAPHFVTLHVTSWRVIFLVFIGIRRTSTLFIIFRHYPSFLPVFDTSGSKNGSKKSSSKPLYIKRLQELEHHIII
jgi:hypothetical protein